MTSKKQNEVNSKKLTDAHHDFDKGLNSYAAFKLNSSATGEDLVQDTFTKTWGYLVKGGEIVMMRAFLYHILNNLIVDEYRKEKHSTVSLDTLIENGFEPKDEQSDRLSNILDGKAAISRIAKLPPTYKKIMNMRFRESMTLQDISTITGKTKNSIAVQIHRGIEKLKVLCGLKRSVNIIGGKNK